MHGFRLRAAQKVGTRPTVQRGFLAVLVFFCTIFALWVVKCIIVETNI
jgi:hypothetical protein